MEKLWDSVPDLATFDFNELTFHRDHLHYKHLLFVVLRTNHVVNDDKNKLKLTNPNLDKLKQMCSNIIEFENGLLMSDNCICYDKYGISFEFSPAILCTYDLSGHSLLLKLSVYNRTLRWAIISVKFSDIISPKTQLIKELQIQISEIQKTLDMPGNLGSIEGWKEILKN